MENEITNKAMTETVPTDSIDKNIIELALQKTPTGGNAKPFFWKWIDGQLEIYSDSKLAAHYLNRNNHTLLIALGCLLESVEIAAAKQNWQSESQIYGQANAVIKFSKSLQKINSEEKFMNLINRSTYRGTFAPSQPPLISDLSQEIVETEVRVRLIASKNITSEFKNLIVKADTYLWLQTKAAKSFFKEVRFFDHRKDERGIRSQDLGVGLFDQITLFIFSFAPIVLKWLVSTPLLNTTFKKASLKNIDQAHFIAITSTELDHKSLIQVGRQSFRIWLDLEKQGYSVQPYSGASVTLVDAATEVLPSDTLPKFRKLFSTTATVIYKNQFGLLDNEKPVWLLRVGQKK